MAWLMKESLGIVFNIPYIKQRTRVSTNSQDPFAMSEESGISHKVPPPATLLRYVGRGGRTFILPLLHVHIILAVGPGSRWL